MKTSKLPNPVLIAVGPHTIYAFKYKPRGFKVKLKKNAEVARWSRRDVTVETGKTGAISQFALIVGDQEAYTLEVTTALGGQDAFDLFMQALNRPPG